MFTREKRDDLKSSLKMVFAVRFELTTSHSQGECSTKLSYAKINIIWSCREDLNLQPTDYKSVALPIELRQHNGGQEEIRTLGRFQTPTVF